MLSLPHQLPVKIFDGSLELLLVLGETLLFTLNHAQSVVLVGEGLVFAVDLVLEVGDVVGGNLELPLELDDFVLSFNAVFRIQVPLCSHSLIKILLLLHFGLILHVLFLELGDEIFLQFYLFNHLHEIGVCLVSVLRVGVPLLLNLRDKAHQLGACGRLQVELLLQRRDVVLLARQFVLVLVVGVLDLGQILLHHVAFADQVVNVLLLLVRLLVDPFDFTSKSRYGIGGNHLLVESVFTAALKSVVLAEDGLLVTLQLCNGLLQLTVLCNAHIFSLLNLLVTNC